MILVINTSGKDLEFVLGDKYKSVVVEKQSVALPVETEKFIAECGATWRDISAIGVVVGPGSFTGIRLGIAYATGLATANNGNRRIGNQTNGMGAHSRTQTI